MRALQLYRTLKARLWISEGAVTVPLRSTQTPTRRDDVEEILELVHPHLGQPTVILVDDLAGAPREGVGGGLAEHVTHVGACDDLEGPATLPDLHQRGAKGKSATEARCSNAVTGAMESCSEASII